MKRPYRSPNLTAAEVIDLYSVRAPSGCLIWTRPPCDTGYGQVSWKGKPVKAHQLAWFAEHGTFPPRRMTIDHTCHNEAAERGECDGGSGCPHRLCVNIDHLRVISNGENSAASPNTVTAINAAKTHCVNGHEFTEANTYHQPSHPTRRRCRTCASDSRSERTLRERRRDH